MKSVNGVIFDWNDVEKTLKCQTRSIVFISAQGIDVQL